MEYLLLTSANNSVAFKTTVSKYFIKSMEQFGNIKLSAQ